MKSRNYFLNALLLAVAFWPIASHVSSDDTLKKQNSDLFQGGRDAVASKAVSDGNKVNRIVLLGASYAKGLSVDYINGRPVINKGIAGQQSFEMLSRFDTDVVALNPEVVIIWGFINDIFRSDRKNIDKTIEKIKSCYIEMIFRSRKNGIKPILATEVTMSPPHGLKDSVLVWIGGIIGKASYQEYVNKQVMNVNDWLKSYAANNNIPVLDFQRQLSAGDTTRKKIFSQKDGSHLSEEGYAVLKAYLLDALKSHM